MSNTLNNKEREELSAMRYLQFNRGNEHFAVGLQPLVLVTAYPSEIRELKVPHLASPLIRELIGTWTLEGQSVVLLDAHRSQFDFYHPTPSFLVILRAHRMFRGIQFVGLAADTLLGMTELTSAEIAKNWEFTCDRVQYPNRMIFPDGDQLALILKKETLIHKN